MYRLCAIVPVYNHRQQLPSIVEALLAAKLPVLLIDDGSEPPCQQLIESLAQQPGVSSQRHPQNRGKGAAVQTGLKLAAAQGFSHALQIDADGQHHLDDIGKFIEASQAQPQAMVIGQPIFDASVPKLRYYGRYATHIWVWIECLSTVIADSMCGFRIYPLAACLPILADPGLGQRMEFDTEILVRLHWAQVAMINIRTPVQYPVDGISHFRLSRDNWLLTRMHTRLVLGMLKRLPQLLKRHRSRV